MKRITGWLVLANLILTPACRFSETTLPVTFTEQKATLAMVVCSRGCEQYVLYAKTGSKTIKLFVTNMPDSLKVRAVQAAYVDNQLPVVFSGTRRDSLVEIRTAGLDDRPVAAGKAYKLSLTAIRRRPLT